MANKYSIRDLRWPVWLFARSQTPDPESCGIIETATGIRYIHAGIVPMGRMTFYQAAQTDNPPTHIIIVRWADYVDTTHALVRQTRRPVDQAIRTEVFRLRRVSEDDGRKRFTVFDAELERAGWTAAAVPIPGPAIPPLDTNGNPINSTPYATEIGSALP